MGETTDLCNKVLDLVDTINREQLIRLCDISLVIEKDILDCYGDTLSITLVNIYKGEELLPSGTRLQVEKQVLYDGIKTTPPTETVEATVESVTTSLLTEEPLIETTSGAFLKEWFMFT